MQFAKNLASTLAAEIKVATCEAVAQRLISGIVFEELLTEMVAIRWADAVRATQFSGVFGTVLTYSRVGLGLKTVAFPPFLGFVPAAH